MSEGVDLTNLSIRALLGLEAGILSELDRRGLVRTSNKPIGDVAEQIVRRARGGVLEPNSTKSHDITTASGCRIQVKAMGDRKAGLAAKFSPFRSVDFDRAVFLVFTAGSFEIAMAREVPAADVDALARYSHHVNGKALTLRQVREMGVDVTSEMRAAYEVLDAETLYPTASA